MKKFIAFLITKKVNKKIFVWSGTNKNNQFVSGEIISLNLKLAKIQLNLKKIKILSIKRKNILRQLWFEKIKSQEITVLLRQLATLLQAGIALPKALDIIQKTTKKQTLKALINDIASRIHSGDAFSDALKPHAKYFNTLSQQLIKTAEFTGNLDTIIEKTARHREKIHRLKSKVKSSLFYPACVLITAIITFFILLIVVIPQFKELFSGSNITLPLLTRIVIGLSVFVQHNILIILIFIVFLFLIFYIFRKKCLPFLEKIKLKLPIVGTLYKTSEMAKIFQMLSLSTNSGIPILSAFNLTTELIHEPFFHHALQQVTHRLKEGDSIATALEKTTCFSSLTISMIQTGEESGKLDNILSNLAGFYASKTNRSIENLVQALEPLIILTLGIMVGILVIAMYLPIFKLGRMF